MFVLRSRKLRKENPKVQLSSFFHSTTADLSEIYLNFFMINQQKVVHVGIKEGKWYMVLIFINNNKYLKCVGGALTKSRAGFVEELKNVAHLQTF